MKIEQNDIWLADLNSTRVKEPGKTRPVVVIQTNLLNNFHLSTLICSITTNIKVDAKILRIHLNKNQLAKPSDILVDQIRAIDNNRLIKKIDKITQAQAEKLKESIRIILDL